MVTPNLYSFKVRGRTIKYSPYTSRQEKDILLSCSTGVYEEIDLALKICGIQDKDIEFLTPDEKLVTLYKLREVSVGDEMPAKFTCPHCGHPSETVISITDVYKEPVKASKWIKDPGIANPKPEDCFKEGYGDLDYDKYLKLKSNLKDYISTFNFNPEVRCASCGKTTNLNISNIKFVLANMSEESITSLYKTYTGLVFNGRFSLADIDSMYPFERMIYIAQIKQLIEERNKART